MNWLTQALFDALKWFFDPAWLIKLAFDLITQVMNIAAYFCDDPLKSQLMNIGSFFQSVPLTKLINIGLWLASPVVDPTLTFFCLGLVMKFWLFSLVVKGITYVLPVGGK
jgi:hypothetical protein